MIDVHRECPIMGEGLDRSRDRSSTLLRRRSNLKMGPAPRSGSRMVVIITVIIVAIKRVSNILNKKPTTLSRLTISTA